MKKFLFLLCWIDGSDSACGEATGVHNSEDLFPLFELGNDYIFNVIITAENAHVANFIGKGAAFDDGYTSPDTVSVVIEITEDDIRELQRTHTTTFLNPGRW